MKAEIGVMQQRPRTTSKPWKPGGEWRRFSIRVLRRTNFTGTLILDFWLAELWESMFLLLKSLRF